MNPARRVALTATCSLALAMPFSATAQTTQAPEEASPQDIVVTANKRAERLKDVPASITAISAEALVGRGANGFEDYAAKSPGLNINNASAGGGLNQISIRGVTTGGGGNPTVGFYIDDAPFGSSTNLGGGAIFAPDLDPSDLARIEVLRGPQGTLYGAGSMGGLIKFVTQSPNFDQFSGRIQVDGNQVDGGGTGYGVRAAANIPLSGNLGLRVSGFDRWDPGFVDDAARDARNVNGARFVGGRASLAWRINDDWSIRASALIQHQSGHGTSTEDFDLATGKLLYGDLRQVRAPGTGALRATYNLYDVRIEGHLGWADLVSATSYGKLSSRINTDATPLYGPMLSDALGLPGLGAAIQAGTAAELTRQSGFRMAGRAILYARTIDGDAGITAVHGGDRRPASGQPAECAQGLGPVDVQRNRGIRRCHLSFQFALRYHRGAALQPQPAVGRRGYQRLSGRPAEHGASRVSRRLVDLYDHAAASSQRQYDDLRARCIGLSPGWPEHRRDQCARELQTRYADQL